MRGLLLRRRRLLPCKPVSVYVPRLEPHGPLQQAVVASLAFEPVRDGYHFIDARKPLRLDNAVEVLGWFGLVDGRDLLPFPSTTYRYRGCDPHTNTVLAYIAPRLRLPRPPVKILVPEDVYILDVEELTRSIRRVARGRRARVYVVSKYGTPGRMAWFIQSIMARHIDLYVASISSMVRRIERVAPNIHVVPTQSHRKLVVAVLEGEDSTPVVVAYRGSMNVFIPGVDDYLEAVNEWEELKRVLHGLFRAFLIY